MTMARTETSAAVRPGSGEMFDGIAHRYDPLNRLMTFGLDSGWRKKMVRALELPAGAKVLDLATGTGAVALLAARRHNDAEVIGLDPSPKMLELGRQKVEAEGLGERVRLELGEAEQLPFPDESFDGVTVAFGIRNVADRPAALREIARVLKAEGVAAILEANEPQGPLAPFTKLHTRFVVPLLGSLLSSGEEYRYLQTSMEAFPPPAFFSAIMAGCGLEVQRIESLGFGTCSLFVARRFSRGLTLTAGARV
jgi:demethylmenaquinone methyltransferase / 2-methoxy-6-polyprenyl-1,4-benzoquinol methylase